MKTTTSGVSVTLLTLVLAGHLVSAGLMTELNSLSKMFAKKQEVSVDPAVLAEQQAKLAAREQDNANYFCVGVHADAACCDLFNEEAAKEGDMASMFASLARVSCERVKERETKRLAYVEDKNITGAEECSPELIEKGREAGEQYAVSQIKKISNLSR